MCDKTAYRTGYDPCHFDRDDHVEMLAEATRLMENQIVNAPNNQPATMEHLYMTYVNVASGRDTPFEFFEIINCLNQRGRVIPVFINGNWLFHSAGRLGSLL